MREPVLTGLQAVIIPSSSVWALFQKNNHQNLKKRPRSTFPRGSQQRITHNNTYITNRKATPGRWINNTAHRVPRPRNSPPYGVGGGIYCRFVQQRRRLVRDSSPSALLLNTQWERALGCEIKKSRNLRPTDTETCTRHEAWSIPAPAAPHKHRATAGWPHLTSECDEEGPGGPRQKKGLRYQKWRHRRRGSAIFHFLDILRFEISSLDVFMELIKLLRLREGGGGRASFIGLRLLRSNIPLPLKSRCGADGSAEAKRRKLAVNLQSEWLSTHS